MTDLTTVPAISNPTVVPHSAPKLRGEKRKFADAWLRTPNFLQAAKAAGAPFGHEAEFAQKMKADRKVQDYITYHLTTGRNELRIPRDLIRDEMAAIAMSNPMNAAILDDKGNVTGLRIDRLDGRDISQLKITPSKDKDGVPTVDLKFHPKADMVRMLALDSGMMADEGKPLSVVNIHFSNVKDSNIQVNAGDAK